MKIYKVGGCIRDEIMGIVPKDIDLACEAESFEAMEQYIRDNGGKIYQSKPEFFTVRARLFGEDRDFVLCRKESKYSDGRRPDSVEVGTIYDDLARRDFTINAMAKQEGGKLIDPFGGKKDIEAKLIRCVGNTIDRFAEDSLRIIRALRFSITKGFSLHHEIVMAFRNYWVVSKIHAVSQERIREELLKCFSHSVLTTLAVLDDFPLVKNVLFQDGKLWLKPTLEEK